MNVNLSYYTAKIAFKLFEEVISTKTIDGTYNIAITKTLYPFSVYLLSVELPQGDINGNAYNSISLVKSSILDNVVYSVDVEGSPTVSRNDHSVLLNVSMRDVYFPNTSVRFNFVTYNGFGFSYVINEPLVEVSIGSSDIWHIEVPSNSYNYGAFFKELSYIGYPKPNAFTAFSEIIRNN